MNWYKYISLSEVLCSWLCWITLFLQICSLHYNIVRYVAPVLASIVFLIQISSELRRRERSSFSTTDRDRDIERDIIPTQSLNPRSDKRPGRGKSSSFGGNSSERYTVWYNFACHHYIVIKLDKCKSISK